VIIPAGKPVRLVGPGSNNLTINLTRTSGYDSSIVDYGTSASPGQEQIFQDFGFILMF